ncbi:MAG TPA: nickel pincer cofactor biosynthesis protein LarB [Thermoanaerobaculia bacterium]|nr:nickel pincer cofactor biosynthesis protein LarB [Thermoanaerobaculia bacterium]
MSESSLPFARIDADRFARTGVAEAIYAPGKSAGEILAIAAQLVEARRSRGQEADWPVLATRVDESLRSEIAREMERRHDVVATAYDRDARLLEISPAAERTPLGRAAVLSAGTTDRGPASEAASVLAAYGAEVARFDDVGVAGLHRLLHPERLDALERAQVVVVAAGMEGALPTVVAGLIKAPVIGLPTPVGYGVAEGGRVALDSMLASCAPGVTVVNIGNGFGAAAMAVKILRACRD